MAGRSVGMFFLFGLGLIFLGILFRLFGDGVVSEIYPQVYVASDGIDIIMILWNVIPIGLLIMGFICLFIGGLGSSRTGGYYQ